MPASQPFFKEGMLSIVIPTLDEAAAIGPCLTALEPLRNRGVEIIVVDGGSTDGTAGLARPLADRVETAPASRASQMNAGTRIARGDILLFLHADTRLPADADRLIEDALANGARVWGRFDVRIDSRRPALRMVAAMMNLRSRLSGIATGDQAIFVRRASFEAAGRFPEIPLMEDIALSHALRRASRPICLAERVTTSGRRWEKHGILRTIFLMWRLRAAYFLGADPAKLAVRYGYAPRKS